MSPNAIAEEAHTDTLYNHPRIYHIGLSLTAVPAPPLRHCCRGCGTQRAFYQSGTLDLGAYDFALPDDAWRGRARRMVTRVPSTCRSTSTSTSARIRDRPRPRSGSGSLSSHWPKSRT